MQNFTDNVTAFFEGLEFKSNFTNVTDFDNDVKNPAVAIFLSFVSAITIFGNCLVIVAVAKEMYLRTVTNYYLVSLAIADLIIGAIVMPFSISNEMTNQQWLFGSEWCDLWHSLDVLASTASILNLCVISLDRYWAINDPIAYPSKMSTCKVCILIALVWLCSAGISFPAIAWWKAVTPPDLPNNACLFTEDSAYLIFSSFVSFYCPLFIMLFVYFKIYQAASAQTKSLKMGTKVMSSNGTDGEVMTLRIHRGRKRVPEECSTVNICDKSASESEAGSPAHLVRHHHLSSDDEHRPTKYITKRLRQFAISKKLSKLAREQKAAKTLGIVVGVFIICWLPFFVTNVLFGLCNTSCVSNPDLLFPVFTWLGYLNSGVNPVIYALSMRDFRRAFSRIIFACCPKTRYMQTRRQYRDHPNNSQSTSSFSATCTDRCSAIKI